MAKPTREPMRNVDKAWLDMDTPTNLMIINGVMLFDGVIDADRFCDLIQSRLVDRYRRFRQRVYNTPGAGVAWEDDPHFDLRCHVRHIALPLPGTVQTLQALVSDLISEALEANRPLWRFYLIENVEGGCAIFGRIHHAIADGIALVQVLLSLTDADVDAPVTAYAPPSAPRRKRSILSVPFRMAGRATRGISGLVNALAEISLLEDVYTASYQRRVYEAAYVAALASLTGGAILSKLLLIPPDNDSVFKGNLGAHKRVIWSESMDLETVKQIGRSTGATVNDVLVAAVAGALRRYMLEHGEPEPKDIRAMVPVNLRAKDVAPDTLGNEFALVYLTLPLQLGKPLERLRDVKRQMDVMKQSPEPLIVYELLSLIGMAPGQLANHVTNFFSSKASVVLTNVPGPRQPIYFAGQPLRRIMFWVPQSGRIGLGISIISYRGEVTLGVMVDDGLVCEPERLIEAFAAEFEAMAAPLLAMQRPVAAASAVPIDDTAHFEDVAPGGAAAPGGAPGGAGDSRIRRF